MSHLDRILGRMVIDMTEHDKLRADVIGAVAQGRMRAAEAADLLQLSIRQVRRLCEVVRDRGLAGLPHGLRGRPSNRSTKPDIKARVLDLLQFDYAACSTAVARQRLLEEHGINLCSSTLRIWKKGAGLGSRRKRLSQDGSPPRRELFGWFCGVGDLLTLRRGGRGYPESIRAAVQAFARRYRLEGNPPGVRRALLNCLGVSLPPETLRRWLRNDAVLSRSLAAVETPSAWRTCATVGDAELEQVLARQTVIIGQLVVLTQEFVELAQRAQ